MNHEKNFLLLIGSPKQKRSTSLSIGTYLSECMTGRGYQAWTVNINLSFEMETGIELLLDGVDRARIITLVTPLYIDCLPAPVIRALEIISKERRFLKDINRTSFAAILNCGFPEARHNNTALEICRIFAGRAGFQWSGALSLGGGGMIAGKNLHEMGRIGRRVMKALDITAAALANNNHISQEAVVLMAKPLVPGWLYTAAGNHGWKRKAKKLGTFDKLHQRPYEK